MFGLKIFVRVQTFRRVPPVQLLPPWSRLKLGILESRFLTPLLPRCRGTRACWTSCLLSSLCATTLIGSEAIRTGWAWQRSYFLGWCGLVGEQKLFFSSVLWPARLFQAWQLPQLKQAVRQGCINCGILVSRIRARGVSSEHMENMEMFSCSPT